MAPRLSPFTRTSDVTIPRQLVLRFVIPVACTYGEPLCDEVEAQFYLLIVFLMSGGRG